MRNRRCRKRVYLLAQTGSQLSQRLSGRCRFKGITAMKMIAYRFQPVFGIGDDIRTPDKRLPAAANRWRQGAMMFY
jgi:hypothetical protein